MSENITELIEQAEASGDPKRMEAARTLRAMRAEFRAENRVRAAQAAVAAAEGQHNDRMTDLRLAVVAAEEIAAPRIAAVARAKEAVAAAEAEFQAKIVLLRNAVTAASGARRATAGK